MKLVFRIAILCSFLAACLGFAQVATINTRGQEPTQPPMAVTGGTGASNLSDAATKSLQMKVTLPAFANLVVGEPFDYELSYH